MRVLMVEPGPNFSVADVHAGWSKALGQAGCQVVNANFAARLEYFERMVKAGDGTTEDAVHICNENLRGLVYDTWPDLIVITSSFYVSEFTMDVLRARTQKVVLLHTESPYEDEKQIARAFRADVNIVNDPTNIDQFPEGTVYLPHSYDPDVHHPGPSETKSDFALVGTGYPSRVDYLEQVEWPPGAEILLAGNWQGLDAHHPLVEYVHHPLDECYPNDLTADLYRGTRSSLNLYRKEAMQEAHVEGWAMGPREVELAACGTFYLTEERGENREVLPMVPTVDGPLDFSEKLAWWLNHDAEREAVATKALAAVADRTFLASARKLLQIVN
jgi:hypothetical protein